MEAWSRLRTSSSSLPTTSPSSSTSSSSASLRPPPPPLFDLADELWFYGSVVPLPSLSLPCLPGLFSSSPDPSTLIAQCMFSSSSARFPRCSSSSSSPTPPPDLQPQTHISPFLPVYDALPAPPDSEGNCADTTGHGGYYSSSDEDEDASWGYPRASAGEDEEAYHYYTAPSDWDDEDPNHGYHVPSDCDDEQQVRVMKQEVLPADAPQLRVHLEPDDALSGIYDVGVLLKDQHQKRAQEVSYLRFQREAASLLQVPSCDEQGDVKESLKLWAHTVATTLPWKAAAQARSLL